MHCYHRQTIALLVALSWAAIRAEAQQSDPQSSRPSANITDSAGYSATERLPEVTPASGESYAARDTPTLFELQRRLDANDLELKALRAQSDSQAQQSARSIAAQPAAMQIGAVQPEMGVEDRIANLEQEAVANGEQQYPLVRLSGFMQLDSGWFSQDAASKATLGNIQNGVGFRRTRLQALGKVAEFTNFSVEMDFSFFGHPSFMDVWGEQTNLPIGNIRIGQYRQPVTMDSWTSVRHLEFLERSAPFYAFDPFRRVGIMDWYVTEDQRTLLAASFYGTGWTISNGATTQYNTLGIDNVFGTQIGDNGGCAFAARMTHLLYYDDAADGRYLLHVGGGYNFAEIGGDGVDSPGTVGGQTYRASSIPEFFVGNQTDYFATSAGTPNVLDTGRFLAHNYSLYHLELAGNSGSFHWQTEWMGTAVAQYSGPLVLYNGAYAQCGYFLTGEAAGYNRQMGALDYNCVPFNTLAGTGPGRRMCGWGAWELAFRWSYLDLQSNRINPLNYQGAGPINPATGLPTGLTASNGGAGPSPANPNPGVLNESTLALNWYWNQFTRVQFNWIHSMLSSQYHGYSQMDIFATRYQIEF